MVSKMELEGTQAELARVIGAWQDYRRERVAAALFDDTMKSADRLVRWDADFPAGPDRIEWLRIADVAIAATQ